MKKHIALLIILFSLFGCKAVELTSIDKSLGGKWKLTKIIFGFPPPNSPRETNNVQNETISFDVSNKTYSIVADNKATETGKFDIVNKDESKNIFENQIVFIDTKLYSTYTLSADNLTLSLYAKAPIGARLADGSTNVYTKQP